jgi:alpha-beta hydrolase superfamily lysophospholipase
MAATVYHLDVGGRSLLGTLHSSPRLRARSAAVLLCNPFGEEASRAHRTYRVLATQLEQAGYATLRFDYSGTGDSSGDDHDATIDLWLADIMAAADQLRADSRASRLVVVGLRLGATLAGLATSRGALRPRHLILCDPIVDGRAYLNDLVTAHRSYMRSELASWNDRLEVSADGRPAEALGARISPALGAQLGAIDLAAETLGADLVTVLRTHPGAGLERLRARLGTGPSTRWIDLPGSAAWNSDAALNAATVPMNVVRAVVERIETSIP